MNLFRCLFLVVNLYHQFTKVAVKKGKALCAINVLRMAIDKYRSVPSKLTSLHADLVQVSTVLLYLKGLTKT